MARSFCQLFTASDFENSSTAASLQEAQLIDVRLNSLNDLKQQVLLLCITKVLWLEALSAVYCK